MLKKENIKKYAPACAVFILSIAVYAVYIKIRTGVLLIDLGDDGDGRLYISIADNFLSTGHFTQTSRPERLNMVVPFGLPLILTSLRIISKSDWFIVSLQYILYGITNVLIYRTERNFLKSSGIFSVLFLWLATFYRYECSPACLGCTEIWYVMLITAELYVLSLDAICIKKKMTWLNILTYFAMVIRPFLSPLFFITAAITVYLCFVKKRFSFTKMLPYYAVMLALLAVFLFINHRESGQWVLFENYAAMDMWWANNERSDPMDSNVINYYDYINNTVGIDYARDHNMYTRMFREYILSCPSKFLSDTLLKFYIMYVRHWCFLIVPVTVSTALAAYRYRNKRLLILLLYFISICMAVIASVSIICHRYTIFIVPLYGLICAAGFKILCEKISQKALKHNINADVLL